MAMEEPEASSFETGDTLAAFVASTGILSDAWRLCSGANAAVPGGFTVEHGGNVGYIAFSSIQAAVAVAGSEVDGGMVELDGDGLFRGLRCRREGEEEEEEEEPVMVHGGMLRLFESIHGHPYFQEQVTELLNQKKPIIITGHSIGASAASLTALWLLCYLKSITTPISVLCITFGAPLLGNDSFANAILKERWGGKFCHVVSSYDLMPRLFFAPIASVAAPLNFLLRYWNLSTENEPAWQLSEEEKNGLLGFVVSHLEIASKAEDDDDFEERPRRSLWPFGSYLLCSIEGGICMDNAVCAIEMMRLMMLLGSPDDCINDHLKYGDYVSKISHQFLMRRQFIGVEVPESSYEASVSMALQSSGTHSQESISPLAEDCLKTARRVGMMQNINSANLAIRLSKVVPFRAEIEWYQSCCDESLDQLGYYDTYKINVSRMVGRTNMNRIKLGRFWDGVIEMLVNGNLPYDFDQRSKWVHASHNYMLLVEPLDIAEYYKTGEHRLRGHYLTNGRSRRFEIIDRWWKEREAKERGAKDTRKRSRFAKRTQDSCFWAKVEEAKDCLDRVQSEADYDRKRVLLDAIGKFEMYASGLIENKEVSIDVLARNSTYSVWAREWQALKTQLQHPFI